jgi:hypothetical protein
MSSEGQIKANRANATPSTGPRRGGGKTTSRFNARRRGLASSLRLEPGAEEEVERLTRAIAGEEADNELVGLARKVAEAEIVLRRVFRARMMLPAIPRRRTDLKLVSSPSAKLFHAGMRRVSRPKHNAGELAVRLLKKAGWSPDAPLFLEGRPRESAKMRKRTRSSVTNDALCRGENLRENI